MQEICLAESLNSKIEEIQVAVEAFDSDKDGVVANQEVMDTLLSIRKGALSLDAVARDLVLTKNSDSEKIQEVYDHVDPDGNGVAIIEDVSRTYQAFQDGSLIVEEQLLIDVLNTILPGSSSVIALLNGSLDKNGDGRVSDSELVDYLLELHKNPPPSDQLAFVNQVLDGLRGNGFKHAVNQPRIKAF